MNEQDLHDDTTSQTRDRTDATGETPKSSCTGLQGYSVETLNALLDA